MELSEISLLCLSIAGVSWLVLPWGLVALWRVRKAPLAPPPRWPSFSVLKPMAGLDDELLLNLQSHLRLDYPGPWRLLLGVRNEHDPAYPIARAFVAAHPDRAELHLQEGVPGFNPKVNQLLTLTKYATGEVIAVTDSNVRVHPGLLREHAARLAEPGVALSSNLFVGVEEGTMGSALDNMSINAFCAPSSATAEALLKMTQLVGKSFAVKREILAELGGWDAVKDLLAEDQRFGALLRQSGHRTRLCPTPVENVQQTAPLSHFWQRHARWSMLRFHLLPGAWAEPLQLPLVWAAIAAAFSPSAFTGWFLLATTALTVAYTQAATWILRGRLFPLRWAWLIPWRDFALLAAWLRGMTMRTVTWRGNRLEVVKNTVLQARSGPRRDEDHARAALATEQQVDPVRVAGDLDDAL